jgi:putative Ig domain-containing protein
MFGARWHGGSSAGKPLAAKRLHPRAAVSAKILFLSIAVIPAMPVSAANPGPVWEQLFRSEESTASGIYPPAVRYVADGSFMVVVRDYAAVHIVRLGEDGTVLTSQTIYPPASGAAVVADAFGAVIVSWTTGPYAGPTTLWTMKYDGITGRPLWAAPARYAFTAAVNPSGLTVDTRGDVFVTGSFQDTGDFGWLTVSFDGHTGALRWSPVTYLQAGAPRLILADAQGNVVVTGEAPSGSGSLWATVKYDGNSGATTWGPVFSGLPNPNPGGICPGPCFDPTNVVSTFDRENNLLLAFSSYDGDDLQWWTSKYARDSGALLWGPQKVSTGGAFGGPLAIAADLGGDVVVSGSAAGDSAIVKYAGLTGARLWGPVATGNTAVAIALDGVGRVCVVGFAPSGDLATAKLSGGNGSVIWTSVVEPEILGQPPQISLGSDAIAVGSDGSLSVAILDYALPFDLRAVRYASETGTTVWGPSTTVVRGALNFPLAALPDAQGNATIVSDSLIKYGPDGRVLWGPIDLSPVTNSFGALAAAVLDHGGNVFLAGTTGNPSDVFGFFAKYSGATGALVWGPIPVPPGQFPTFLAVDPAGDLLVLGTLNAGGWSLSKYTGASGTLIWGPAAYTPSTYTAPMALAVDRRGNVFVTGPQGGGESNAGWATAKYSASSGALLWGPVTLPNTAYGLAYPTAMALDSRDDLIVTGRVTFGWETIKYSGGTGVVLWGPRQLEDDGGRAPSALAIGPDDSPVVVGLRGYLTHTQTNPYQVATIKYSGVDGQTKWGPLSLPTSISQAPPSVAVAANADVVVAMTSFNGTDDDWTILKYRGFTGDVVWGPQIYDSGGNDDAGAVWMQGSDFFVVGSAGGGIRTVRYTEGLAIQTLQRDIPPAYCGQSYAQPLQVSNGTVPFTWSLAEGSLPLGMSVDRATGQIFGTPAREGSFTFTVRVEDSLGVAAQREFFLDVVDADPPLSIAAVADESCLSGGFTLSVSGSHSSYAWRPGGETTPSIHVCPTNPTLYSVAVTDPGGCEERGAISLQPYRLSPTGRLAPQSPERKRPHPVRVGPRDLP